jgi:hypothetical protein
VNDKADSSSVGSLASSLVNLSFQDKIDFDGDPDSEEFGFGGEKRRLELRFVGDETPLVVESGGPAPIGPNIYLRSSEHPHRLYMVASFFPEQLQKDVFHWRNKRLFPTAETEGVEAISWKGKISVESRKLDGRWALVQPVAADANFIMMEGLASTLVYATARSVFSDSRTTPEARSLLRTRPVLQVEFQEGGESRKLALYPRPGQRDFVAAVGADGPLLVVDAHPFDRFTKSMIEYRDRRIFAFHERGYLNELSLRFPREKKEITLKHEGGEWAFAGGDEPTEALSQRRIRAFVSALTEAEATTFLPASSQAARLLRTRPADLLLTVKGDGLPEGKASFLVVERKSAVTEGRSASEVRTYGEDFLKVLPIRLQDLYESNNQQVIPETKKENDGHDHSHHHHHGHQH